MPARASRQSTKTSADPLLEAEALLQKREYEAALSYFDQALSVDPDSERALGGKLTCLRLLRRFDAAWQLLDDKVGEITSSSLLYEQGMLYFDQKQHREAIDAFDRSLEVDPS